MPDGERVRIEVGFDGGQVITGFVDGSSADQLERALHENGARVVVLETEDGPYHVVVPQVSVPRVGSFKPTSVHSGDGGPFVPVELSGLDESRHTGSQRARFVSGVAVQEQLVWRTSRAPLMVMLVLEPSFDCPCAVASREKPFSLAFVRTSPLLRLGRL